MRETDEGTEEEEKLASRKATSAGDVSQKLSKVKQCLEDEMASGEESKTDRSDDSVAKIVPLPTSTVEVNAVLIISDERLRAELQSSVMRLIDAHFYQTLHLS